jgi:hypothetical protein
MKNVRNSLLITILSGICLFLQIPQNLSGQGLAADYLKGGIGDGNKLLSAYLKPLGHATGAGLNNGWYNTAETHKVLGFSVSLIMNASFVPSDDKSYNVTTLGLTQLSPVNPGQVTAPTLFGSSNSGAEMEIRVDDPALPGPDRNFQLTKFNAPKGTGLGFMPTPTLQGAIGLPKGTELMFRFLPKLNSNKPDLTIGLWGVGVKHDIKQWIPIVSKLPVDLAFMAAFTRLTTTTSLDLQPDANSVGTLPGGYNNQEMEFDVKAFTTNLVFSKKILFFTPHVSVGYNFSKASFKLNGDYPIPTGVVTSGVDTGKKIYTNFANPISTEMNNINDFRVNVGFRLKFLVLGCFFADYTLAKYSTLTAGLGISFR